MDLFEAVKNNDFERVVNFVTTRRVDINQQTEDSGYSALIMASTFGYLEIVRFLIIHGANINLQNKRGDSALMAASFWGHFEIVKFLVENGADINQKNKYGRTALTITLYFEKNIVNYLSSRRLMHR